MIRGPAVDRDRDQRQVLRQGQRPVGAQLVPGPESLGAAQQDARGDLVPPVQVQQRVGGEPAVGALALAEVAGELDSVLRSQLRPISRPSAAAATPSTRLTTTLSDRRAVLALLGQPLRFQHPGRERRVRADGRRARQQCRVVAEGEPGEQAQDHRAGEVDSQGAEREVTADRRGHGAVDQEPRDRARPRRSARPPAQTSTLIAAPAPSAPARWPGGCAAYPATMLAAAYPAASPYAWALSIFRISTCIVENVDRPPHSPVPSSGRR